MEKKELDKIVRKAQQGFTLIEIMVVVGIIGLLAAVLIPNVTSKMNDARIASARVQIKNVEEALVAYSMKHGGKYPDSLDVLDHISVIAAVGHRMAFRPGVSGKIFAALGQAGINIRMINQGPDEVNIIFGVENKDFAEAIRVLYNSFIK